jgi:hypothetical protein
MERLGNGSCLGCFPFRADPEYLSGKNMMNLYAWFGDMVAQDGHSIFRFINLLQRHVMTKMRIKQACLSSSTAEISRNI